MLLEHRCVCVCLGSPAYGRAMQGCVLWVVRLLRAINPTSPSKGAWLWARGRCAGEVLLLHVCGERGERGGLCVGEDLGLLW